MIKTFHVGCKAVIIDKQRGVLLLSRKYESGDFYNVPGGRIDDNETFIETLTRELNEELPGCKDVKIGSLLGARRIHKDIADNTSLVLLFFKVEAALPETIELSKEHDAYMFVKTKEEIPYSVGDEIRTIIEELL